jgi:hexosaminidase
MLFTKNYRRFGLGLLCLLQVQVFAQHTVVPMIAQDNHLKGGDAFQLSNQTIVYYNNQVFEKDVAYLQHQLLKLYGIAVKTVFKPIAQLNLTKKDNCILVDLSAPNRKDAYGFDTYTIYAEANAMRISVQHTIGFFYSIQTLLQLIGPAKKGEAGKKYQIPATYFSDYPRFAYRGMHLDVARHFFSVADVKRYIDYMAFHKFNMLHWHLTDDQGWRIEIKKYPLLTQVGAWRNGTIIGRYPGKGNDNIPYGGFYTQEQVKDIVQYAADRHIGVIPEIEMPGHASAAIAAYPQLSCFPDEKTDIPANMISEKSKAAKGKLVQETWGVFEDVFCPSEYTFNFLQDVLDEVIALFPAKYIHIGGDECPKEAWKKSAFCQQLIKDKGLKDEHGLQSWFIQRIEKYVNGKGLQIVGWDEILEGGLAPNATVMSWRGEAGGIVAAQQQHAVIMTPGSHCYLDHSQTKNEDSVTIGSYLPLEKVYAYEPIPKELNEKEAAYILGAQGNVWTEYITNTAKLEYMVFPRMAALAEVLWSPKEKRNWADFEKRLPNMLEHYQKWGIRYSKAYYDIAATVVPGKGDAAVMWKLEGKHKQAKLMVAKTQDGKTQYQPYTQPMPVKTDGSWQAVSLVNGKQQGNAVQQRFYCNKATGKPITLIDQPSKSYPGDGAFTLVNGVQSEKGFARSAEFLGFSGNNCQAVIDLGKPEKISKVVVHALRQEAHWIWQPLTAEVWVSADGKAFTKLALTDDFVTGPNGNGTMTLQFDETDTRYVKLVVANWGEIPAGNPGAGNKAWLFVDEVEVW